MTAPLTVDRIRDAAAVLRDEYLPLMQATHDEVWQDNVDLSEPLANLLETLAAARQVGVLEAFADLVPLTIARLDDALTVLAEKILGAHA